jgi:polysaccharide chain length determinant protein (PEP-CTERM system associated)
MAETHPVESGFNTDQLRKILQRRYRWLVIPAALGVLVSLGLALGLPPVYESSTTILIEAQGIPERLVESTVVQDKEARFHNIRLQILARDNLSAIIDEFDLYPNTGGPREDVVERMREDITIEPILPAIVDPRRPLEIDSFRIAYRGPSPDVVASVANWLGRDFIKSNLQVRSADAEDTSEFIETELRARQAELNAFTARISEYKQAYQGELPEQLDGNRRSVDRLMIGLAQKRAELEVADRQVRMLKDQVQAVQIASTSAEEDPVRRRSSLELQLNVFKSRGFTEKHPDVVAAKAEIAELDRQIEEEGEDGKKRVVSPQEAQMMRELRNYRVQSDVLKGEIELIAQQIEAYEVRIESTPQRAAELGGLEEAAESSAELIRTLQLKKAEADIARSMELKQKGERFRVVESAVPAESPVSPNRPLVFVVGTFLGVMMGAGLLVFREMADRSFYSVPELGDALGLTVLAAVPVIRLPGEMAERRARHLRWGLSTAVLAALLLAGGLVIYSTRSGVSDVDPTPEVAAGHRGDV